MEEKKDPYATPGIKLVNLYSLLVFTGRQYSLPELAAKLRCSKQTVLRMMEQLERVRDPKVESWMEGGRKWYKAMKSRTNPNVTIDAESLERLLLCRDFVWNLLPESLRDDIDQTVARASVLLPETAERSDVQNTPAISFPKGLIDYTPHQKTIDTLLTAFREHRICVVTYRSNPRAPVKSYSMLPLRLIAYREGLYLLGRRKEELDSSNGHYDTVLAVHRIKSLEMTDETVEHLPKLPAGPPGNFGLIPRKPFRVEVAIKADAAAYVSERQWSSDQKTEKRDDGSVVIHFSATDRIEVKAWVMGFGPLAELLAPQDLRDELGAALRVAAAQYVNGDETTGNSGGVPDT